jgi:hypothetical protein
MTREQENWKAYVFRALALHLAGRDPDKLPSDLTTFFWWAMEEENRLPQFWLQNAETIIDNAQFGWATMETENMHRGDKYVCRFCLDAPTTAKNWQYVVIRNDKYFSGGWVGYLWSIYARQDVTYLRMKGS